MFCCGGCWLLNGVLVVMICGPPKDKKFVVSAFEGGLASRAKMSTNGGLGWVLRTW